MQVILLGTKLSTAVPRCLAAKSCLPWAKAGEALLSLGFPRQEYLEWVAFSFSNSSVMNGNYHTNGFLKWKQW